MRYSPSPPKITKRAAKTRNRNQTQPTPTDGPTGVAPIQWNLNSTQPTTAGDYASNASQSHSVEALVSNGRNINDLEDGVTGNILKFADDTKLFRKVKEIGDKQKLQDDIDKLVKWSEKWQMLFNFGKCKCLHTGSGNTGVNYEMGGTILSKTVKEKDLGVTMNANNFIHNLYQRHF